MPALFDQLPRFKWRGVEYPISGRSVSFAHESVQHKLQRRNQDLVEQTGAHNLVFSYTIPMREGINKGPYRNLFLKMLPKLFEAVRDRSPGELIDPVYGIRRAVPASYMDELDVMRRDGVDLRLEFTDRPEDDEEAAFAFPTVQSLLDDRRDLEVAAQEIELEPADEQEAIAVRQFEQIKSERGVSDILDGIAGLGQQINAQINRVNAAIEHRISQLEKIEAVASSLSTPNGAILRSRARRSRASAYLVQGAALQNATARRSTNSYPRSVASIAAQYGVTVAEFLQLNPQLASKPIVASGVEFVIPNGAER